MAGLTERFAEVEQRVRALVADNQRFRGRVQELERELDAARRGLHDLEQLQAQRTQLRERLERVLALLESLKTRNQEDESASQRE